MCARTQKAKQTKHNHRNAAKRAMKRMKQVQSHAKNTVICEYRCDSTKNCGESTENPSKKTMRNCSGGKSPYLYVYRHTHIYIYIYTCTRILRSKGLHGGQNNKSMFVLFQHETFDYNTYVWLGLLPGSWRVYGASGGL